VIGTSLSPKQLMPNETTLYWRVRAIDVNGDAGQWNLGGPFTESFDLTTPTIPNLNLVDSSGKALSTDAGVYPTGHPTVSPIVTWNPVPGASSYEYEFTPFDGTGCDWTGAPLQSTATTAWTPFGVHQHIGPSAWPDPQGGREPGPGGSWCFRVLARRDDGAQGGGQVISDWTQLGGFNRPAFYWPTPTPATGALGQTQPSNYILPAPGGTIPNLVRTPLFTWSPVAGANGSYIVVARDIAFTDVVDVGYTTTTAYAPRIANKAPYADESTNYYWAVVPAANTNGQGNGVYSDPEYGQDSPQSFNKSSVPPTPLSPTEGSNVPTQPTFHWTSAETARSYRLQIAGDPTFGNPIEEVVTDSTAYTSETTLPADRTLYWRVRANDTVQQGLNWSSIGTFTHRLPPPAASPASPAGGDAPPILSWTPVTGATSYDIHIDPAPNGSAQDGSSASTAASFKYLYGPGVFHWQVRANFPGGASSAYFTPVQPFVHTLPPPAGVRATKSGTRIVISWQPDSDAKTYQIQLSPTDGFGSTYLSDSTDNTTWVPQIDATTAAHTIFWRLAAVDQGGNIGAYASGVFHAPAKAKHKPKPKKKRHK
jgi:hypothetical protein